MITLSVIIGTERLSLNIECRLRRLGSSQLLGFLLFHLGEALADIASSVHTIKNEGKGYLRFSQNHCVCVRFGGYPYF